MPSKKGYQVRIEASLMGPLKKEAKDLDSTPPKRVNRILKNHFSAKGTKP